MADVFASAPPLDGLTFDEFASKPSTDDLFGSFWSELTGSPVSSHSAEGSPSYFPSSPNNDAHSSVLFEGFDPSGTFSTQMTLEPIIAKLDVLSSDGKKKRPHPSQSSRMVTTQSPSSDSSSSVLSSDLSTLDPKELERLQKKQKRLLKNRESAQLSRQRKKAQIEEMERKLIEFTARTEALEKRNAYLEKANRQLREELQRLQPDHPLAKPDTALEGGESVPPALAGPTARRPLAASRSAKVAGMALLVVLFSFGLFFNHQQQQARGESPIAAAGLAPPQRTFVPSRVLKSLPSAAPEAQDDEEQQPPPPLRVMKQVQASRPAQREPAQKYVRTLDSEPADARQDAVSLALEADTESLLAPARARARAPEASGQLIPVRELGAAPSLLPPSQRTRPPTEYIYCSEAHRIQQPDVSPAWERPNLISLLLPGEVFNVSSSDAPSLVEVTCSVLDVHTFPLSSQLVPSHSANHSARVPAEDLEAALQPA